MLGRQMIIMGDVCGSIDAKPAAGAHVILIINARMARVKCRQAARALSPHTWPRLSHHMKWHAHLIEMAMPNGHYFRPEPAGALTAVEIASAKTR